MMSFIGRQAELKLLEKNYRKNSAELIAVHGRRRVGKSRLIDAFSKGKPYYHFVGLAPQPGITAQSQRDAFAKQLQNYGIPVSNTSDWSDLFGLLALLIKNEKAIVFFDEISWMAQGDASFMPKLKTAWDTQFSLHSKILMILCGSISSWIERNILSSSAFVGRVSRVLHLRPLPLEACNQFWAGLTISPFEKFKVLSITGGIPRYIEAFDLNQPFMQNIQDLVYSPGGFFLREFDVIFQDLFERKASAYKTIIQALSDRKLNAKAISESIDTAQSGVLTDYLNDLDTAGFIARDYSWQFKTGEISKLSLYRIKDNYVRFYLKYVDRYKQRIESNALDAVNIFDRDHFNSILGLQFENLVLNNRAIIWDALNLKPEDIIYDGPYFQSKTASREGCQIDYLIQTRYNNLFVCEIKLTKNTVQSSVVGDVQQKIKALNYPKYFSCFPVLIHLGDIAPSLQLSNVFTACIDFSKLLGNI